MQPTLGQLWANNVVDSLNSKPVVTPQVDAGMQAATETLHKRATKKQALADSLLVTQNQQGMV